jgi:hypothetical protein
LLIAEAIVQPVRAALPEPSKSAVEVPRYLPEFQLQDPQ